MTRRAWLGMASLGATLGVAAASTRGGWAVGLAVTCAGLAYVAVAVAAHRDHTRLAVLAGCAATSWVVAEWWPALLWAHRPLMAATALSFPAGRLPRWPARIVVAALAVAACFPPAARSPQLTVALAAGLGACAWDELRRAGREARWPGSRREGRARAGAAALLAGSLAVPAALRWLDPFDPFVVMSPAIAPGLEVIYCALVAASGIVLLLPLLGGVAQAAADSAVDVTGASGEDVLSELRRARSSSPASSASAMDSAVALLEDNMARHAELEDAVEAVRRSRRRLVEAAEGERRALRRLLAEHALPGVIDVDHLLSGIDGEQAAPLVRQCRAELASIGAELERLAQGLHPRDLERDGLGGLHAAVAGSPVPVSITVPTERLAPQAEAAAWYACTEAVSNAVKHAGATRVTVEVSARGDLLVGRVFDDGAGGATIVPGGGLGGLRDRLEAAGGRMAVTSPTGRGTTLMFEVPLP